jgi:hypothetical protein
MTLAEVLPAVRQLTAHEKLKLIRILAEDLERNEDTAPFESGKVYDLPTPYDSFGTAQVLQRFSFERGDIPFSQS